MRILPHILTFFQTAFLCCTLVACAQKPSPTKLHNNQSLKEWQILGLVALNMPNQHVSATLNWVQDNQNYRLDLVGTLGIGHVSIIGSPQFIQLETAKGREYSAKNPKALMQKTLGWSLPIADLYYWIRGLPAPDKAYQAQYGVGHQLLELQQNGWQIKYQQYAIFNNYALPSRMELKSHGIQVKIALKHWKLP
ncbi:MAG: lipoprotein insertase outer membrane protein LolB [Gammaproteobacteria bacterium]